MGKLVMVISAAVTSFILALTAAAVYAYSNTSATPTATQPVSQVAPPIQIADMASPTAAPTATSNVSPQDAAAIAGKFLNRTDLYSVEVADSQGTQSYKVTFATGDAVYVSLTGQVLSFAQATALPTANNPVVVVSGGSSSGHGGGGGGGGSGGGWSEDDGGGDH